MAGKPGVGSGGDNEGNHRPGHGSEGGKATQRKKRKLKDTARAEVEAVYRSLQKREGMSLEEWAASHPKYLAEFYTKLYGKLVPNEVTGAGGAPVLIQFKEI